MLDAYEGIFLKDSIENIYFVLLNTQIHPLRLETETWNWHCQILESHLGFRLFFLSAEIICISAVLPPEVDSWGGCRRYREKMSGQTLTDRIAAAQYQLTGSDVARAVCKATTHEVMAPKKKHLDCKWDILHSPSFLRPGAVQFSTTVQRVQ